MIRLARSIALVALFTPCVGSAHETDQFTVPTGWELVDLGMHWNRMMYDAVQGGVDTTNADIRRALTDSTTRNRRAKLERLQSSRYLASAVARQFPYGMLLIESLEAKLRSEKLRSQYPGRFTAFRPSSMATTYTRGVLLPDPRLVIRGTLGRSSTIKVHGCCFGIDKLGHFIGRGQAYYRKYLEARQRGVPHRDAMATAVASVGVGVNGELGLLGIVTTGVFSNADLAANYVGMKFFINLTEPVMVKNECCPSMLVREGPYWKLQPHVRPDGRLFAMFVSQHYDEALNPNWYDWAVRQQMRQALRPRRKVLLDWYAGRDPQKRCRSYFDGLWSELTSYYGEDYGHDGDYDDLVTLGNTFFEQDQKRRASDVALVAFASEEESLSDIDEGARRFQDTKIAVNLDAGKFNQTKGSKVVSIGIRNSGIEAAADVDVQIHVAPGARLSLAGRSADCSLNANTLTWHVGRLAPKSSQQLRLLIYAPKRARPVNTVQVFAGTTLISESE